MDRHRDGQTDGGLTDGLHGDVEEAEAGAQWVHLGDVQAVGAPELRPMDSAGARAGQILQARPHMPVLVPADGEAGW